MADLEKLSIKLGLSGTFWDRRPNYEVLFNGQVIKTATVSGDNDQVEYVEFDVESTEDTNVLAVRLLNKQPGDTVENEDKTAIVQDMLLNIVSLEIDEIDLGMVPFNLSEYRPDHRSDVVKNCMNLGWNGTWSLSWTNPFYIWLLESL